MEKKITLKRILMVLCCAGLLVVLLAAGLWLKGKGREETVAKNRLDIVDYHTELFGENVFFFSPEDDVEEVQATLEHLWQMQETNQFGDSRYAVYFLPGEYAPELSVKVGYYMQVAGLGASPDDTTIAQLNCDARWLGDSSNHNATCNFWRGVENLHIQENCMWAVSQATFMRRVHLDGSLYLHDENGWASGGFLADALVEKIVDSGSQQQWLSRNCDWKAWLGENWNMVFAGIAEGKAPVGTWPAHAYTDAGEVAEIREKPFLMLNENQEAGVFVPAVREQASDVSWNAEGGSEGSFYPLDTFYVAKPEDTSDTLNEALKEGKNLLFTPGIYELDSELVIERDDCVVLGMGLATLRPTSGNRCIYTTAKQGIILAGLLFDAGEQCSETLLQVGVPENAQQKENSDAAAGDDAVEKSAPICLSDVFFRVGGVWGEPVSVKNCVTIASDHVLGDNLWVWRADHGDQVGWDLNTAPNGIVVDGDDVTIYALMVEHFQEYQTVWNGENGKVIMYQSETPYDVPRQSEYVSHDGSVNGFASYYVAEDVKQHEGWGIGIYSYNRDAIIEIHSAVELPETPDVRMHNVCAIMITGFPGISHVINEYGDSALSGGARAIITEFPMK